DQRIFLEVAAGGDKIDTQVARLQRPTHILVATPGRLYDLLKRKAVALDDVQYLILDEADEML
ncbi:MAG TPA: DEAD/DEAH box helicase, partial [Verrucomicrobiales bacterium]|nr:DEAD/DEAH box helicase [Verrucomicrobiales bacterium]